MLSSDISDCRGSGAKDRYAALECLAKLATIPYELVHPYKGSAEAIVGAGRTQTSSSSHGCMST
ncbi:hypothetical protein PsorP6_012238 [Peronosclerospora sorghi]|uniref:Uncharacterized protein n=1 Tax=Peronosclerospora sorghi TaxID=230839 RepID=A0ACC0WI75_9STRA|nr:hypothetical protein PsorP6_012238 [Peronosclerospora sorghi]